MKPYSYDLREKVLNYSFTHSNTDTAATFDISSNTVFRLKKLYNETGDVKPRNRKITHKRLISPEGEIFLEALILTEPDLSIKDLRNAYKKKFGVAVCHGTMVNTLKKLNLTYKKKSFIDPEKYNDGAQEQREYYQENVSEIERNDLIYLDEFGSELNMTKTHGRSLKGYPVYEEKPTHSKERLNTIAVLSENGFESSFSYSVSLDSVIFIYFLEYFILPNHKGKTIVMDRHPVHRSKEVKQFMKDNGMKYLYLPPYSPELNPIEEAFSKVKGIIKEYKPRTLECLKYIVNKAMESITKTDAENYVEHAAEFSWA